MIYIIELHWCKPIIRRCYRKSGKIRHWSLVGGEKNVTLPILWKSWLYLPEWEIRAFFEIFRWTDSRDTEPDFIQVRGNLAHPAKIFKSFLKPLILLNATVNGTWFLLWRCIDCPKAFYSKVQEGYFNWIQAYEENHTKDPNN